MELYDVNVEILLSFVRCCSYYTNLLVRMCVCMCVCDIILFTAYPFTYSHDHFNRSRGDSYRACILNFVPTCCILAVGPTSSIITNYSVFLSCSVQRTEHVCYYACVYLLKFSHCPHTLAVKYENT